MDHATTAATATNAVVATGITLWGVATGLSYEVLLAGFAGGLVSLSFLGPLSIWQRIWTPFTATLTAGYTAPVASHYLVKWLLDGTEQVPGMSALSLLLFSAFAVGLGAQIVIPMFMEWLRNRRQSLEGPAA